MALNVKDREVTASTKVFYNDIAVQAIYYNGTLVWPPVDTTCTTCGGSGTLSGTCLYCNADGKCTECLGLGFVATTNCPACNGYTVSWLCNACGYQFTWQDVSGGFSCRCGMYYADAEDAGNRCHEDVCPVCAGWVWPGWETETCFLCKGSKLCSYCGGDNYISGTCPTCNGTGEVGSGSSTQD